jgi:beta-N-acetylhexosaminidase
MTTVSGMAIKGTGPKVRHRGTDSLRDDLRSDDSLEFEWPHLAQEPELPPVAPRPPARPPFRRRRLLAALGALLLLAGGGGLGVLVGRETQRAARPRAALGAQPARTAPRGPGGLSVPRQVAQLFVMGTTAQGPRDSFVAGMGARGWGAVVVTSLGRGQAKRLTGGLDAAARAAGTVPPLVAIYQPGGPNSAYPGLPPRAAPDLGENGRPADAQREALAAAQALRRRHISMTLAPMADVSTPTGPNQDVLFGDDPRLVARMAAAAVRGYRAGGVVAAVGHFPGQGAASADPDSATASVGLSVGDMRSRDLIPFRAVARSAPVIVVSNAVYAAYDGVTPAVLLPDVVTGLLRHDLGFRGVVMTDDLSSTAPVLGQSIGRSAVEAVQAGADLLYVSGDSGDQERAYRAVLAAVRRGAISRQRLRQSVARVLALKRRYGVLAAPRPVRRPSPTAHPRAARR